MFTPVLHLKGESIPVPGFNLFSKKRLDLVRIPLQCSAEGWGREWIRPLREFGRLWGKSAHASSERPELYSSRRSFRSVEKETSRRLKTDISGYGPKDIVRSEHLTAWSNCRKIDENVDALEGLESSERTETHINRKMKNIKAVPVLKIYLNSEKRIFGLHKHIMFVDQKKYWS